jgi:hypothetical protein
MPDDEGLGQKMKSAALEVRAANDVSIRAAHRLGARTRRVMLTGALADALQTERFTLDLYMKVDAKWAELVETQKAAIERLRSALVIAGVVDPTAPPPPVLH